MTVPVIINALKDVLDATSSRETLHNARIYSTHIILISLPFVKDILFPGKCPVDIR